MAPEYFKCYNCDLSSEHTHDHHFKSCEADDYHAGEELEECCVRKGIFDGMHQSTNTFSYKPNKPKLTRTLKSRNAEQHSYRTLPWPLPRRILG